MIRRIALVTAFVLGSVGQSAAGSERPGIGAPFLEIAPRIDGDLTEWKGVQLPLYAASSRF